MIYSFPILEENCFAFKSMHTVYHTTSAIPDFIVWQHQNQIEDISDFVRKQYQYVQIQDYSQLTTPRELVYPVTDVAVARNLGVDSSISH
jgi:hypothetical protein